MTTPLEQLRARVNVLACLEQARERLLSQGWSRDRLEHLPRKDPARKRGKGLTLLEALLPPGASDNAAQLSAWHARWLLVKVVGDLDLARWNAHPYRTRRDVLQALAQAIRLQRGEQGHPRRGGHLVSLRAPQRLAARTSRLPERTDSP